MLRKLERNNSITIYEKAMYKSIRLTILLNINKKIIKNKWVSVPPQHNKPIWSAIYLREEKGEELPLCD